MVLLNSGAGTPTLFNFSSFVSQFNLELLKFKLMFALSSVPSFGLSPGSLELCPGLLSPTISSSLCPWRRWEVGVEG